MINSKADYKPLSVENLKVLSLFDPEAALLLHELDLLSEITDFSPYSAEVLVALAPDYIFAAWEIGNRERATLWLEVVAEENIAWDQHRSEQEGSDTYPNCDPEKGICYCGYCIDNRLENPDPEPTQVWFTESPGGHNGWE